MDKVPHRILIRFYTVLVLEQAFSLRDAACEKEFGSRYATAHRAAGLRVIVSMSGNELEDILSELGSIGLVAGQDFAVGEMVHGEEISCPGICFEADQAGPMPNWFARALTYSPPTGSSI